MLFTVAFTYLERLTSSVWKWDDGDIYLATLYSMKVLNIYFFILFSKATHFSTYLYNPKSLYLLKVLQVASSKLITLQTLCYLSHRRFYCFRAMSRWKGILR